MECSICLNDITKYNKKTLECGHIFHYNCIKEWIDKSHNNIYYQCPLCRKIHISINKNYRNQLSTLNIDDRNKILFIFILIGYFLLFILLFSRDNTDYI